MKVRETYAELDSPLLGFVADFSSTMHAMSPTLLRAVQRAGLDDEALAKLQAIWATDATMQERQQEFIGYLKGRDFDPGRLGSFAHLAFNMHGHVAPQEWADIMPQILHVHAKLLRHRRERPGAGEVGLPRARARLRRRADTAATGPANGRVTRSPSSARSIRCSWSEGSTT